MQLQWNVLVQNCFQNAESIMHNRLINFSLEMNFYFYYIKIRIRKLESGIWPGPNFFIRNKNIIIENREYDQDDGKISAYQFTN